VIEEVGELVITQPMPSMPIYFWDDPEGERYRDSYFSMFEGVWRHGDWIKITERGSAIIYGRSDSTINRSGVRMGTSEIYRAVLGADEILDALVVDIPRAGTEGWMPLFVVLREGAELDDDLRREIARRVRSQCSPRHVPDEVFQIEEVPRTLSGKVLEVPVKRILMGTPAEKAASRDSLANPAALDYFTEMAGRLEA
jgi:acetoacetyl-CoA synthetase